ncbi:MAG: nucleotide pyrophosphohydrolase [Candidatus Krumholzibacteriota bacterium]|nr:nucleotide pyrophosphohydrolase [Candidatus Krumholzibacteriota bacterium]
MKELEKLIVDFRDKRDWKQFHDSKNLSEAIVIEASELLEVFLWKTKEESQSLDPANLNKAADEIADVYIFLSLLCHELGLDLDEIVRKKLKKNEEKYPVDKARGSAKKYTELD